MRSVDGPVVLAPALASSAGPVAAIGLMSGIFLANGLGFLVATVYYSVLGLLPLILLPGLAGLVACLASFATERWSKIESTRGAKIAICVLTGVVFAAAAAVAMPGFLYPVCGAFGCLVAAGIALPLVLRVRRSDRVAAT